MIGEQLIGETANVLNELRILYDVIGFNDTQTGIRARKTKYMFAGNVCLSRVLGVFRQQNGF